MKKKNNLALFSLLLIGVSTLFVGNTTGQDKPSKKNIKEIKQCSGKAFFLPKSISPDNTAFEEFIKVMSLSRGERQQLFSKSTNQQKANIFKVQLALHLLNRPNLSVDQKDLIIKTINNISADTYDKQNSNLVLKSRLRA